METMKQHESDPEKDIVVRWISESQALYFTHID